MPRSASDALDDAELSSSVVVALLPTGLHLPGYDLEPQLPLGLAELRLLGLLARGDRPSLGSAVDEAARPGGDAEKLRDFAASLADRNLLATGGRNAGDPPATDDHQLLPDRELAPYDAEAPYFADTPTLFRVSPDGFEFVDHHGTVRACLDARELMALNRFTEPITRADAWDAHREDATTEPLDQQHFDELVQQLAAAGLLTMWREDDPSSLAARGLTTIIMRDGFIAHHRLKAAQEKLLAAHDEAERARTELTGRPRTPVIPVSFNGTAPPLALGMIMAYAKAFQGGRLEEVFEFRPEFLVDTKRIEDLARRPAVYLCSEYLWSYEECLAVSARVKELSPESVTIHGGPSTPKYPLDVRMFFRDNPHVDVAVHGEGEAAAAEVLAALADQMGCEGGPDLSVLADVPGITYRHDGQVVTTESRDRIADLDTIPSPYLTGLFDAYGEVPGLRGVVIETNRGCPYGCTFCDWGSATLSRIRKFDIDRVFAELEWCGRHQVTAMSPADANFGIFERDVDIAEQVAAMKRKYGYPRTWGANYAKNTVKHLKRIIEILVAEEILTSGTLSFQSMDEQTLTAVERSNIKLEKYEELATAFRQARLPLFVDLMMGLPGQTLDGFKNDWQQCINREVTVRSNVTEMLVNSPMNDPEYRKKHKIVVTAEPMTPDKAFVVSTSTFTRQDYDMMLSLRRVFLLSENFGVLRHLSRFVRQATGCSEVDFFTQLLLAARADPEQWPSIAVTFRAVPDAMAPPVSWKLFYDELGRYLTTVMGVPADSGLQTILTVQRALMPDRGVAYPLVLELPHDVVAWHNAVMAAKDDRHYDDWPTVVPPLSSFGPGTLLIDDEDSTGIGALGQHLESAGSLVTWELRSAIAPTAQGSLDPRKIFSSA